MGTDLLPKPCQNNSFDFNDGCSPSKDRTECPQRVRGLSILQVDCARLRAVSFPSYSSAAVGAVGRLIGSSGSP